MTEGMKDEAKISRTLKRRLGGTLTEASETMIAKRISWAKKERVLRLKTKAGAM